jgi:hypothetical protein
VPTQTAILVKAEHTEPGRARAHENGVHCHEQLSSLANTSVVGGSGETAKKNKLSIDFGLVISTCELQNFTVFLYEHLSFSRIICVRCGIHIAS